MASKSEQEVLQRYGADSVEELAKMLEETRLKAESANARADDLETQMERTEQAAADAQERMRQMERSAAARVRRAAYTPATERRVRVFVDIDPMNPSDRALPVIINGRAYTIRRGEEVEVPESVARVLKNSREQSVAKLRMEARYAIQD